MAPSVWAISSSIRRISAAYPWAAATGSPGVRKIRKIRQEFLVVFQRIGGRFRFDRSAVPQSRVVEQIDMVFFAIETGAHIQERRQEAGRHLVLQATAERPCACR